MHSLSLLNRYQDTVNPFTGEPDDEMEIVSVDGEVVAQASLFEAYSTSLELLRNSISIAKKYQLITMPNQFALLPADNYINPAHVELYKMYKEDAVCLCIHTKNKATIDKLICLNLQNKIKNMKVQSTGIYNQGKIIPQFDVVELLDMAAECFRLAKIGHYSDDPKLEKAVSDVQTYVANLTVNAAPHHAGYGKKSFLILRDAFTSLMTIMEDTEKELPEDESYVQSDVVEVPEEKIEQDMKDTLKDTLQLMYWRTGMYLCKCIAATVCTLGRLEKE